MKQLEQINLKIFLQGRNLLSESECAKNPRTNYNHITLKVIDGFKKIKVDGQPKKVPSFALLDVAIRKSTTIFKVMSFNKEQIKAFLETPISGMSMAHWKSLPSKVKLEKHAEEFVHDFSGFAYELEYIEC